MRSRGKAVAVLYVMMSSALSHYRRYVFLPGKHRVGSGEQVGGDRAFDDECVCPCLQDRTAQDGLVIDADDDQLHLRKTAAQAAYEFEDVAARQRKIDHSQLAVQTACALEQRDFIGHHHDGLECRCKEAANTLAQTVVRVGQQHATRVRFAHWFRGCAEKNWRI